MDNALVIARQARPINPNCAGAQFVMGARRPETRE
jgi:hypothetical protein